MVDIDASDLLILNNTLSSLEKSNDDLVKIFSSVIAAIICIVTIVGI